MKTQFFSRNLCIGLLVAFVVALGVVGNVDAITKFTRGTGDLKTYAENQSFTVSFTVGDKSASRIPNYKEVPMASRTGQTTTYYLEDSAPGYQSENQVSYSEAHYYDQESIEIAVTGANITKVGTYGITPSSSHTMSDGGENAAKLSRSVTLTLVAAAAGTIEINITDTTPPADRTDVAAAPLPFTVYVVQNPTAVTSAGLTVTPLERRGFDDFSDPTIGATGIGDNVRVKYDVISGNGQVYVNITRPDGNHVGPKGRSLTTSSAATVKVDMNGTTNKVTITVVGSNNYVAPETVFFIYGLPSLEATRGSSGQTGATNGRLENPLGIRVKDGKGRTISGLGVTFTTTASGAAFIPIPSIPETMYTFDANNGQTITVETNNSGVAETYYQLGSAAGMETITVAAAGVTRSDLLTATAESITSVPHIEIVSGNNQRTDSSGDLKDPLVVKVTRRGSRVQNIPVTFTANRGLLANTAPPGTADNGVDVRDITDGQGLASVTYLLLDHSGAVEVVASISGTTPTTYRRSVTFNINGAGSTRRDDDTTRDPTPSNTITISPSTLSGTPGDTATITISNPAGVLVNLSGSGLTFSPASGTATSFTSTVTFPSGSGTYTITASGFIGGNTISDTTSVTVTAPGTLTAVQDGGQVIVTASPAPSTNLAFRLTRGGVYAGGGEILPAGTGRAIPIGLTVGSHILTVSAEGYNSTQVSFTPGTTTTDTTTTTTTTTQTGTPGEADSIEIDGQRSHSGTVNRNMGLRVQVTDANNRGVSDVRVTFRILAPGRGRLSQRGNGRGVVVQTDRNGYASASLTPLGGNLIVEAGAAGVTGRVTFIINVEGETDTESTPTSRESSTAPTSRTISPVVHVGKAQRPPMLWIDGGKIYALVGADVEEFASGIEGAMNITVGGGKVYWTEQTGESAGTINSANLDGSGVKELKAIKAVPMGIAVDTENRQLYWTNSRGRIQSADLDGSGIENVMLDLPGPMDIAVARGLLYWTQYDATEEEGSIGITNTAGRGTPKSISTGANMPGSIAIGGNKVYWTEMTGSNSGTINSASLNGSGATELNDIRAVPMGIGVDTARSKLYWTNSRGRVQSANLEGRKIQNVVDGLGNPGDMVLSNSITAPATATQTTQTTASTSKYDINGDGSVDSKDVDALIVAVAAGVTDSKYDVNGDGKVDIFDVSAVSSKRDDGAASAPALLGTKLSIVQIDRLQDQIDLLIASNDRSPDTMRLLIYLQQLIVMARPEKTQLLANYPNPFNPETWIPYELATDTTVKITIYNTQGVVIRTLALGHQSAGYYTGRDRAAYWDGRNAHGETVASGVYFYQFETDEISSMRKMVILK